MVNLKEKPFCLGEEAIQWVEDTIAGMSLDEKAGQLFVLCVKLVSIDKILENR